MQERISGNLIIIGGAEDKSGQRSILKDVVATAGGNDSRLVVMTTATESPEEVGNQYRGVFEGLGVENIDVLNIKSRDDANNLDFCERLRNSTCVFFTGGDQLRITSILGGTEVYKALHDAYVAGALVTGTSAGASVMSITMIVDGNSNDAARKCTLKMAPGLGLLDKAIIDSHFDQRGRLGRLLCGVAENPDILGIGIDEDTAIKVYPDGHLEVLGSNAITIIDGKTIKSSNVSELKPDEILSITNVTLHVLSQGYGFDLMGREVLRLH